jgi:hypothetical protein
MVRGVTVPFEPVFDKKKMSEPMKSSLVQFLLFYKKETKPN